MEFFAIGNRKRPVRLCEQTRRFAYESLNRKYGLQTKAHDAVAMDDVEGFDAMTPLEQYDRIVARIALTAPLRICEHEKLSGAATLGRAVEHYVPATYRGQPVVYGVSHLTVDFRSVLTRGTDALRADVEAAIAKHGDDGKVAFLTSCRHALDCLDAWHKRYLDVLRDKPEYRAVYENLSVVPRKPAQTFYQAVQSIWFVFAFLRLNGYWTGIGRIDALLGDYLERDLAAGVLDLDEAREILAHFFIKGCEWVYGGNSWGSGDAQHYQNIVLAGVDRDGKEVTNAVTYLVLDVLEELGISDFPTTVRINAHTDEKLLARVAEVMRYGGGVLAVYNEELILNAMTDYGYPLQEARDFANDGCWEVQVAGKTYFDYLPFDALYVLQHDTLRDYLRVDFPDFETLYVSYVRDLRACIESMTDTLIRSTFRDGSVWKPQRPCTVLSLFEQGCIEKGLSYLEGGPIYNVRSFHAGGLPDVANMLYAVKKLVFEQHRVTFSELMHILENDWRDAEPLRQYARKKLRYYGNDNDEVDGIMVRLVDDFADACAAVDGSCAYSILAGISTFGRQVEWAAARMATAHGNKKGEVLAANCSPTPNSDFESATAIIRSYCKPNLKRIVNGAALDVKLLPSHVDGDAGIGALTGLMCGFHDLGGFFMQLDVTDAQTLRNAQQCPQDYPTLSVRVSGWNARFVTLNREWQDMVIRETEAAERSKL